MRPLYSSNSAESFLICSTDETFISFAESVINSKFKCSRKIYANTSAELVRKMSNQEFSYIIIDLDYSPIKPIHYTKILGFKFDGLFIASSNQKLIPEDLYNNSNISVYIRSGDFRDLEAAMEKFLSSELVLKSYEGVLFLDVKKDEILCREGAKESALYIVLEGEFRRCYGDDNNLDTKISTGQIIGELTYFSKQPRKWRVVANCDSKVAVISYSQIDQFLESQPMWIKILFDSLAGRCLNYLKLLSKEDSSGKKTSFKKSA